MTGKQEKIKKCPLCSGDLKEGLTVETFLEDDKVIVVKDIPAEVCQECGEAFIKSSVAGDIEKILDKLDEIQSEISVVHYKAA